MMYNSGLADHNSYMILRTYKNENLRISHNNRSCKKLFNVTFTDFNTGTFMGEYETNLRTAYSGLTFFRKDNNTFEFNNYYLTLITITKKKSGGAQ